MYARYQLDPEATLRSMGSQWGGVSGECVRLRFAQAGLPSHTLRQIADRRRRQRLALVREDDSKTAAFRESWVSGAATDQIGQQFGLGPSEVKDLADELVAPADHDRRDSALLRRRRRAASSRAALPRAERLSEYVTNVRKAWRAQGSPKYFTGAQYELAARADDTLPSLSTLEVHFRWRELLGHARLACHPATRSSGYSRISPDVCWGALRAVAAETRGVGVPPTRKAYVEHSTGRADRPCAATVMRRLGGWDQIEANWPGPAVGDVGEPLALAA
jgi:hypothetical protein